MSKSRHQRKIVIIVQIHPLSSNDLWSTLLLFFLPLLSSFCVLFQHFSSFDGPCGDGLSYFLFHRIQCSYLPSSSLVLERKLPFWNLHPLPNFVVSSRRMHWVPFIQWPVCLIPRGCLSLPQHWPKKHWGIFSCLLWHSNTQQLSWLYQFPTLLVFCSLRRNHWSNFSTFWNLLLIPTNLLETQ